jgi:hypothetical protein
LTTELVWVHNELEALGDLITDVKREEYAGGPHITVTFANGYGASIIDNVYSYGVELAVLGRDGSLCYSTPVTSDVIGNLNPEKLAANLSAIAHLE